MSVITPSVLQNISPTPLPNKPKLTRSQPRLWDLANRNEAQKESYDELYIKSRRDWKIWEANVNSQGS